ncbi:MAG: carbamoyl-phosphate synthase large subunit [Nitrospirae bacterium]|nr:carbamoyl-phosphate synthase large subunit [Candidatus Troglogloeales bacterium]
MPKRTDIRKILLIGSGPIIIGQGCEFDYSGTQACRALKEEEFQVILVNSNPATIMTDPEIADATYIEPLTLEIMEKIIEKERPDAILPTMGGQTALNLATGLFDAGILQRFGVELIGASYEAILAAEDRGIFKEIVKRTGLSVPKSGCVKNMQEAIDLQVLFPAIIRPSFTLGGTGASIACNLSEFEAAVREGIAASPVHEVLIEQSLLGWKEFELEVMRDRNDNVVMVCSIENIDPMGIHTGDSITVAPAQTLTDKTYQLMRDAAKKIIRAVGVETGGSNIQFAIHPKTGEMQVIEMNPRVSRSSALASKATGFPIAKIAAKLAIGLTLDEIQNDITRATPACFEPSIDYVVVKMPRFAFEKFPTADPTLTMKMKSVGEVMAIGRNFKEAFQKAIRSLEIGQMGLEPTHLAKEDLMERLSCPTYDRIFYVADAMRHCITLDEINAVTHIDPWFLGQIKEIIDIEKELSSIPLYMRHVPSLENPFYQLLHKAKRAGFSDSRISTIFGETRAPVMNVAAWRKQVGILPVYKKVDTCGGEFEAHTPYYYSSYDQECEANPTNRKKVLILGSGPNRIGQGIEFDYCCVHAALAVRELGCEAIMVNCNPETVSTDYDISDRLYFEPLTFEDVMAIVEKERPIGVIVQFGGQTPLKLAVPLTEAGVLILGTSSDAIDRAEDRERFKNLIQELGLRQPESGITRDAREALLIAYKIGFPILVRPSYVLGGRAMEIIYDKEDLVRYMRDVVQPTDGRPVLIDQYLEDAIEIDVDAVSDGTDVFIGGIMEHIEEAGIHSGDSACSLPPISLSESILIAIQDQTARLAKALSVVGLMNVQYALKNDLLYVLEVNPRGSRTVPFVSKATGVPLAKIAMKAILGVSLSEMGLTKPRPIAHMAVKEAVFPFLRLSVDPILGPEMKSTGEAMGIDWDFGMAYAKAQSASANKIPLQGKVFLSVKDKDKPQLLPIAKQLSELGFFLIATRGTASYLEEMGLNVTHVNKVKEGSPHIVHLLEKGEIQLVINTVGDRASQVDSSSIRKTVLHVGIPYFTTLAGARAALCGIISLQKGEMDVAPLKKYHQEKV